MVFTLAGSASLLHFFFVFERYRESTMSQVESVQSITRLIWVPLALVLAWVAIRTRPKIVLLIVAGLAAAAMLVSVLPESPSMLGLVLESLLVPLLSGLISILLPVLLGGACGAYQSVLIAFGVAWAFDTLAESGFAALSGPIVTRWGQPAGGWAVFVLLLVAVIVLIPVDGKLFTVAPQERGRTFAPADRSPAAAFVLSWFVPFYAVYWIYRIHGEEAFVKPSRKLLSPRAAAWLVVIPLIGDLFFPFMLSSLADHNNEVSVSGGGGRVQRPWVAFLFALIFPPAAIALIQSALNEVAERGTHLQSEPVA